MEKHDVSIVKIKGLLARRAITGVIFFLRKLIGITKH